MHTITTCLVIAEWSILRTLTTSVGISATKKHAPNTIASNIGSISEIK